MALDRQPGRNDVETEPEETSGGTQEAAWSVVRGRVVALVKGGFEVELVEAGGAGFCSLAQMDTRRVSEVSSFLNQELDFARLEQDAESGVFRLSRRKVLEREARARIAEIYRRVVPNALLRGRVARLTDFGAFIDLGGVEGMVHLTEISHGRVERPADVLDVGQEVDVRVLRVSGERVSGQRRRRRPAPSRRISLSIKRAQEDPWSTAAERFRPWHVADGRVVRVVEFGAFLELAPGIEGLLHESELPSGALARIEEASRGGAVMAVLVLQVDSQRRRISLAPAPGGLAVGERVAPVALRVGKPVVGRVQEIQSDAVLLRLGPGQVGVIPDIEMGTSRGADHREAFPPGSEIQAEVLRIEAGGRRARLSRKKLLRREERAEVARHMKSQSIESLSTLGDLLERARRGKES